MKFVAVCFHRLVLCGEEPKVRVAFLTFSSERRSDEASGNVLILAVSCVGGGGGRGIGVGGLRVIFILCRLVLWG